MNYIVKNENNYYVKSEYIKVYPCISRGKSAGTSEENTRYPINPEALLYTELNITTNGGNTGLKQNFLDPDIIQIDKTKYYKLVMSGYLFLIDEDAIEEIETTAPWASIKLKDVKLTSEYTPNNAENAGIRDAYTKILDNLYSTQTVNESNASTVQTISNTELDNAITDGSTTATVFAGLKFTTAEPSEVGLISLNINSVDATHSIGTNRLDDELITQNKLGTGLINTDSANANGIVVTLTQETAKPHKFNIGITSSAATNAQYITNASGTKESVSEGSTDAIQLLKFNDGKIIASELSSGNTTKPVYVDGGKIKPLSATVGSTTNPIYLNAGVITASTADVCNTAPTNSYTPMVMNAGVLGELTGGTIGSTVQPIYMDGGAFKPITGTKGNGTKHIYLDAGQIKESATTRGTASNPVYLNNGEITVCNATVGGPNEANNAFTLMYMNGGTFSTSQTLTIGGPANTNTQFVPIYVSDGQVVASTATQLNKKAINIFGETYDVYTSTTANPATISYDTNSFNYTNNTLKLKPATTSTLGGIKSQTASTGTYINSDGKIVVDNNGTPTIYYKDTTYTGSTNIEIDTSSNNSVKLKQSISGLKSIIGDSTNKCYLQNISTISANDTIYTSGKVEASYFNATSDARLKENIKPFEYRESILDLPIYNYDFKQGNKNQVGCLAQDLQKLYPELVNESASGYLSIQESKLVYLLMEEVKQLKARIEELEKNK